MKIDELRIAGTRHDRRTKLNDDARLAVMELRRQGYSLRRLADMFRVSKRLIQHIVSPGKRTAARPKPSGYWAEAKRRTREYKRSLITTGTIHERKDKTKCK